MDLALEEGWHSKVIIPGLLISKKYLRNHEILHHMPQLDGLRAIAVFMVFYHHFMPWSLQLGLPWGESGVDLFFVLSGFLITGILLKCRRYTEVDGQSVMATWGRFYARRCLRIFPLYYVALVIYATLSKSIINELTPWLWTYTLNIFRTFVSDKWGGPISHLWSLSIEEQFYLIWPWVILLIPRRLLLHGIIFAIIVGPATKLIMGLNGWSDAAIRYFTLACLDTLALGGALAYFVDRRGLAAVSSSPILKWMLWISLPMVILGLLLRITGDTPLERLLLLMSGRTLFFGWVVIKAANGFRGIAGRFLAWRPIVYLGTISYGLYLLHKPIPLLLRNAGLQVDKVSPFLMFLVYTGLAIIIASLSWHLFETPINSLKRRFPYRERSATT
jgi:peptidoglycan/LPS O-acetylase OafA/YrhL